MSLVEACRRLAQAPLTRPGLTDIDRYPVQNLGTARLPNLDRMRHTDFHKKDEFPNILMQDRKFHHFIILTIIVPLTHDYVIRRENALGDPLARRLTRPRRVRPGRVHRRCSPSSIPDALCDYPASAKAGGCIGCRVARPLGKASASELAGLQGARTSARSATADRGAEISYVERRRTSRPLAHWARARPGRGDAYRNYSGADLKIPHGPTACDAFLELQIHRGRAAGRVPFGHSNLIPVRLYRIDRKILLVQTALRPFPWSEPLIARLRLRPSRSRQ